MKKYQPQAIFLGLLLVAVLAIVFAGEVVLPFVIGLLAAWAVNPLIRRIQRWVPNRSLAVTSFMVAAVALCLVFVGLFGVQVARDVNRLNHAFVVFAEDNEEEIDQTLAQVKSYIQLVYSKADSIAGGIEKPEDAEALMDSSGIDLETIKASLANVAGFFGSNGEKKQESGGGFNWFIIFFSAIGYFSVIAYTWPYFEARIDKYFGEGLPANQFLEGLVKDFKRTFLEYFGQRSRVVLICSATFVTTFLILGIPGAILLGILAGLLCYITNFHYLSLIPLSLCCWVRSMETGYSFFLYLGVIVGVFILISVLEELIFFPKIMKGVSSMNPAIMAFSLALWGYLFGILGIMVALPLTTALLLVLDRLLLRMRDVAEGEGD